MPIVDDLGVSIVVDGKALTEYRVVTTAGSSTTTCFIEAHESQRYMIELHNIRYPTTSSRTLSARTFIDGTVQNRRILGDPGSTELIEGRRVTYGSVQPFLFSSATAPTPLSPTGGSGATSATGTTPTSGSAGGGGAAGAGAAGAVGADGAEVREKVLRAGSVRVEFWRVSVTHRDESCAPTYAVVAGDQPGDRDVAKGERGFMVSHVTRCGDRVPASKSHTTINTENMDQFPYKIFIFEYRSRSQLELDDIIPSADGGLAARLRAGTGLKGSPFGGLGGVGGASTGFSFLKRKIAANDALEGEQDPQEDPWLQSMPTDAGPAATAGDGDGGMSPKKRMALSRPAALGGGPILPFTGKSLSARKRAGVGVGVDAKSIPAPTSLAEAGLTSSAGQAAAASGAGAAGPPLMPVVRPPRPSGLPQDSDDSGSDSD
ncbi:hypothetical protein CXG81DRAFT_23100 [Caulochytrium protostelioides]|uniref:DUF7918 domain-containing protein n=1 Tax=Caulochytrium protostelioides TaxID=1555241 RepID=A0A4P9XFG0_9FUNG|nr:hypothetical protein CXG81DRAFT_23100 [Caulochytrium protostelioides]|eukprot:RKP04325.1 hypothetical protein CXG81DRAFT_23100 [Caulochytrium protostelioides]